ncbi:MAG TPA: hypothetical protein VND98_09765 [Solirubrobacterales bacterium]|nr:hypothetical protein [Solirubrobacterales bacterium]
MPVHRRFTLPPLAALIFGVIVLGVAGCGYSSSSKDVVAGQTVTLGKLQYTVVFSRYLNPNDSEDAAFLAGQPPPPPATNYYGVFLQVQNEDSRPHLLPKSLKITDTIGQVFKAIPSSSVFAMPLGGTVEGEEQEPVLDSPAQQGPIQGSLVLFRLPAEVSSNRPLTLSIPGSEGPAEVTLDL